jgi:hypothetical protein
MKKLQVSLIIGLLLAFMTSMEARAVPILANGDNVISFLSYETATAAIGTPGFGVGTVLYGILSANSVTHDDGSTWIKTTTEHVTGIFMGEVATVTNGAIVNGFQQQLFVLKPVPSADVPAAFAGLFTPAELAAGSVMKLYTNPIDIDNGLTGAPVTDRTKSIANAVAGTPWLVLNQTAVGTVIGPGNPDYFLTNTLKNPATTVKAESFAQTNFGLSVFENFTGVPINGVPDVIGLAALEVAEHYAFPLAQAWDIRNTDPASLNAVPEPASLIIMGSGLMGLFGLRRRQKKNV